MVEEVFRYIALVKVLIQLCKKLKFKSYLVLSEKCTHIVKSKITGSASFSGILSHG